jgi:hypothetical protein
MSISEYILVLRFFADHNIMKNRITNIKITLSIKCIKFNDSTKKKNVLMWIMKMIFWQVILPIIILPHSAYNERKIYTLV